VSREQHVWSSDDGSDSVVRSDSHLQARRVAHRQRAWGTVVGSSKDMARSSVQAHCAVRMGDSGALALARTKSTRE